MQQAISMQLSTWLWWVPHWSSTWSWAWGGPSCQYNWRNKNKEYKNVSLRNQNEDFSEIPSGNYRHPIFLKKITDIQPPNNCQ